VITPEGTRSRGETWRSGFYRIARAADLPVMLGYLDSVTRTTGLGPTLRLTGDVGADMDRIRDFYADKAGIHPEKFTPPRLVAETSSGSTSAPAVLT
jgi:1-acyl-sn-glycerol-3-phosphate acyltransferase